MHNRLVLGPIALVGSGEFTPAMEAVDAALLDGQPQRVVHLPTAAALEGPKRLTYWVELGRVHYARLGVEAEALQVMNRNDAENPAFADRLAGAGLIYLSGGNPAFLARTLAGTLVGDALRDAWRKGSAVAGCSAGAMALMESVPDIRNMHAEPVAGLAVVAGMRVMPHFDQIERWAPGAIAAAVAVAPAGAHLVGIDEDTAIVGGPGAWRVMGRAAAWVLHQGSDPDRYGAGGAINLK